MSGTHFYRLKPDGAGAAAALKAGRLVAGTAAGDTDVTIDIETRRPELAEWLLGAVPQGSALGLGLELRTTDPEQALTALAPLARQAYLRQDPPPAWQDLIHDDLSWQRSKAGRIEVSFGLPTPPFSEAETRRIVTERLRLAARKGLIDGVDFRSLAARFMAEFTEVTKAPERAGTGDIQFFGTSWSAGRRDGTLAPGGITLDLPDRVAESLHGLAGMFEQGSAARVTANLGRPDPTELKALDLTDGSLRARVGGLAPGEALDQLLDGIAERLEGDRAAISWQCAFKGARTEGTGVLVQFGEGDGPEAWLCLGGDITEADRVAARVTKAAGATLARSEPEGGG